MYKIKQKKAGRLKAELNTLLLNSLIYTIAEGY